MQITFKSGSTSTISVSEFTELTSNYSDLQVTNIQAILPSGVVINMTPKEAAFMGLNVISTTENKSSPLKGAPANRAVVDDELCLTLMGEAVDVSNGVDLQEIKRIVEEAEKEGKTAKFVIHNSTLTAFSTLRAKVLKASKNKLNVKKIARTADNTTNVFETTPR